MTYEDTDMGGGFVLRSEQHPECELCGQRNDQPSVSLCRECEAYMEHAPEIAQQVGTRG